jgi:O-acetyl-ADP-ribose deacetylase (regulator of RNase III)
MTVAIKRGDLLRQDVDAIVNTVNTVGIMGKGIALQFKQKWPENFRAYERACRENKVRVGEMFIFDAGGLVKPHYHQLPDKRALAKALKD